ncbi:MAG: ATP-grasp domain-containing protein [Candidatus Dormibacteria bacterium]
MSSRVLLILPSRTYRARAFLEACRVLGVEVVVAGESGSTLGHLHPEQELLIDPGRPREAAERAQRRARRHPFRAVIPADEAGVLAAAEIAARLKLPGNPPGAVAATRDKLRLRQALAGSGLTQPAWTAWEEGHEPAFDRFPCVVKPLDQAASRGVVRADDRDDLERAGRRVRALLRQDPACAPAPGQATLLIEEFIPGPEVALEGLFWEHQLRRLAVYDKPEPLDGPFFEESIYTVPSELAADLQGRLWDLVERAVTVLGLGFGAIHAELRLGPPGPVLVDLASRSIGGRCSRVLTFACGLSLEALIVQAALGAPVPDLSLAPGCQGVLMLPSPRSGRLRAVPGRAAAATLPGVSGIELTIPLGGPIVPWPEGDRYLGFVFASGASSADVVATLRRAQQELGIAIEP